MGTYVRTHKHTHTYRARESATEHYRSRTHHRLGFYGHFQSLCTRFNESPRVCVRAWTWDRSTANWLGNLRAVCERFENRCRGAHSHGNDWSNAYRSFAPICNRPTLHALHSRRSSVPFTSHQSDDRITSRSQIHRNDNNENKQKNCNHHDDAFG